MCGSLLTKGDFHRPLQDMQLAGYEPITPSMAHEPPDQQLFLLAALPPSKWQNGLALGIVLALLIAFGATAPLANTQLPRVDAFIPTVETAIVVSDLATSACCLLNSP